MAAQVVDLDRQWSGLILTIIGFTSVMTRLCLVELQAFWQALRAFTPQASKRGGRSTGSPRVIPGRGPSVRERSGQMQANGATSGSQGTWSFPRRDEVAPHAFHVFVAVA